MKEENGIIEQLGLSPSAVRAIVKEWYLYHEQEILQTYNGLDLEDVIDQYEDEIEKVDFGSIINTGLSVDMLSNEALNMVEQDGIGGTSVITPFAEWHDEKLGLVQMQLKLEMDKSKFIDKGELVAASTMEIDGSKTICN